jgi:hypothetical protein
MSFCESGSACKLLALLLAGRSGMSAAPQRADVQENSVARPGYLPCGRLPQASPRISRRRFARFASAGTLKPACAGICRKNFFGVVNSPHQLFLCGESARRKHAAAVCVAAAAHRAMLQKAAFYRHFCRAHEFFGRIALRQKFFRRTVSPPLLRQCEPTARGRTYTQN